MDRLNYFDAADLPSLRRDYPIGDAFTRRFTGMSRDELRSLQEQRFRDVLAFAWKVPFYRRHWGNAGVEPGDIKGLDDIAKLPMYSKSDLMESVEQVSADGRLPRNGRAPARPAAAARLSHHERDNRQAAAAAVRSEEPRSAEHAPRAHVPSCRACARRTSSIRSTDFGMVNGGHYIRETIVHWVGAQLLTAGTGTETRSAQQVALMRDFGVTVLAGFGDFVKRLAEIARENGIEPGRDIRLRMITGHLGPEGREPMSEAWGGCAVYDWYGVGDTGIIAGEGPDQSGMYVVEDAQYLELVHTETGRHVEPGEPGDMVCTCLFKDDIFPIIRFNTHDVTEEITGASPHRSAVQPHLGLPRPQRQHGEAARHQRLPDRNRCAVRGRTGGIFRRLYMRTRPCRLARRDDGAGRGSRRAKRGAARELRSAAARQSGRGDQGRARAAGRACRGHRHRVAAEADPPRRQALTLTQKWR